MKDLSIRSASLILDIILLMVIQQSQTTTIRVNLCKNNKQRKDVILPSLKIKPNKILAASLKSFRDVKSVMEKQRISYENNVGSHQVMIKNIGVEDFYPSKRDTRAFKLPRKRKARVLFEIQWMLTSMIFQLKVADVLEKDFSFSKIEKKVKVLAGTWKLLMYRLGFRTTRKRNSCYREIFLPKLNTRRETSKHASIVLRDIQCNVDRLIHILSNCRIRRKRSRKTKVTEYIFTCGKGVRSVFYNRKRRISPKECEIPKKLYSLSQL